MSSSSQSFEHASCNPLRWTLTSVGVLHLCLHLFLSLMIGLHVLLSSISIRSADTKKRAAQIVGNMCSLVTEPKETCVLFYNRLQAATRRSSSYLMGYFSKNSKLYQVDEAPNMISTLIILLSDPDSSTVAVSI